MTTKNKVLSLINREINITQRIAELRLSQLENESDDKEYYKREYLICKEKLTMLYYLYENITQIYNGNDEKEVSHKTF